MVLLGLLLMACAAAFAGLLIAYNLSGGPDYTVTLLGSQPFTINTLGAFLGGVALTLIFGLGMWMLLAGTVMARRRSQRRRMERVSAARSAPEYDESADQPVGRTAPGGAGATTETRRPAGHRPHWLRGHAH
ncbi:hypothetical protein [Streptomyces sp. NPDC059701]|uniref:hypothetical protein n=1 Tax=Streptomyces sp. NPDC059701 TaxID=3346914 RepID=UPI0036A74C41